MKLLRNCKLVIKIILSTALILISTDGIAGFLYYNYAYRDTLEDYYSSARDITRQINAYLTVYLQSLAQRIYAMGNNVSFRNVLNSYLYEPSLINFIKLQGMAGDTINQICLGDKYVHSIAISVRQEIFDNFSQIRRYDFVFEESPFYKYFQNNPDERIAWFPTGENPLFISNELVIPIVFLFQIELKPVYIIIFLKQSEFKNHLSNAYSSVDRVFIIDRNKNDILNLEPGDNEIISSFLLDEAENDNSVCKEISYNGGLYLGSFTKMSISQWAIYAIRSSGSLLENLDKLREFIILVMGLNIVIGIAAAVFFSYGITRPLSRLISIMNKSPDSGFSEEFIWPYNDEIGKLAGSFNYMVRKIHQLVDELNIKIRDLRDEEENLKKEQQQKRKAELKALQAQINPHFLYNTLNTISWYAADGESREIAVMSNSLGKFFRIALSKGHEFISVREELEHVYSYLAIQSIRYKSKLSYSIDAPEEIKNYYVIKLLLQPLVENALYHGIKPKDGEGHILVSASEKRGTEGFPNIVFEVIDNGVGIKQEKLDLINFNLSRGIILDSSGYGIYNVNARIRLYYGENYGLRLENISPGIRAILVLPIRTVEEE
jgi:two-component system sensor histidine kinase YesM